LGDALADVGARDAVAKDTQVFPVVDSSPIDTTAPNPVPDAQIVVDTAVPVPPVPDAAVGPGPQEPTAVLNNPKVMGSGFCSVNSMPNSAPGLFTFFLVAAFGLLVSRRRRR
jgi:MYXO-CTERM domain-containing protein